MILQARYAGLAEPAAVALSGGAARVRPLSRPSKRLAGRAGRAGCWMAFSRRCSREALFLAGLAVLLSGSLPLGAQGTAFSRTTPIDYYLLLDNSGSIQGVEREIAREAAELLVTLASDGDQFVVYRFGEVPAKIAQQVIQGAPSRARLRDEIASGLTFDHKRTDITAALQQLKAGMAATRRPGVPAVALLVTDGRLIPNYPLPFNPALYPQQLRASYTQLLRTVGGLDSVKVHTVGMGTTDFLQPIGQGIPRTGETLLREDVARPTGGVSRHAPTVNDLILLYVELLKQTKGISDISEGSKSFRTDQGTRSVSIIVVKRTANQPITHTRDVTLTDPGGTAIRHDNHQAYRTNGATVEWSSQSDFFDVITVRQPAPGTWSLNQPAMFVPDQTLDLAVQTGTYSLGAEGGPTASIRKRTDGSLDQGYRMQARVGPAARFPQGAKTLDMEADASGTHRLPIEAAVNGPGEYAMQVIATRPNVQAFYRRSAVETFTVAPSHVRAYPISATEAVARPSNAGSLRLVLLPSAAGYPFDVVHEVRAEVTRPRGDTSVALRRIIDADSVVFAGTMPLDRAGNYRAVYIVEGRDAEGGVVRQRFAAPGTTTVSEWWWSRVRPWLIGFLVLILLLAAALVVYNLFRGRPVFSNPFSAPRLRGNLTCLSSPEFGSFPLSGRTVEVGQGGAWMSEMPFSFTVEGHEKGAKFRSGEGFFEINEESVYSKVLQDQDLIVGEANGRKVEIRYNRY